MPILQERSQLSHIATNFGSDTTTANVPNKSSLISSRTTDLENAIPPIPVSTTEGVNYFLDIDATGFTVKRKYPDTDFKLNQYGQPRREQQMYLDMKGDFSPLYTMFHTAEPVFRVGSPNPGSPMENIPTVNSDGTPINSLYNRASTPNRMGFSYIPEFEDTNRYPTVRPTTTEQSRIYFKHTTDKSGIDNAGFTRPGLGLSNYYDQLIAETGILGIRNESSRMLKNDNQPFVVRDIGSSWEIGEITGFGNADKIISDAIDFVSDTVKTGVLGRDSVTFGKVYLSDALRTFKIAPPVSTFVEAQTILQEKQPQRMLTTAKYELGNVSTLGDGIHHSRDKRTDIRKYWTKHLYSIPLQNQTMFDRFPEPHEELMGSLLGHGIGKYVAEQLNDLFWEPLEGYLKEQGKKAIDYVKTAATKKFKEGDWYQKNITNNDKLQGAVSLYKDAKDYKLRSEQLMDKLRGFDGISSGPIPAGKRPAAQMNIDLFDVGVDKVNLIPYPDDVYGKDSDAQSVEELDFVPFKFRDAVNDKYIVFRALLSGIADTFSPEYATERYVGRPDSVHVYQGTERSIQFTFDVYPKSVNELAVLWRKLNYLAGLTYPTWAQAAGGGAGMIAPFAELTIGQMYTDTPGYISALTYTIQDNGTWETTVAKLPKYVQVNCTFTYVGKRLPSTDQKHFEMPWVAEVGETWTDLEEFKALGNEFVDLGNTAFGLAGINVNLNTQVDAVKGFGQKLVDRVSDRVDVTREMGYWDQWVD